MISKIKRWFRIRYLRLKHRNDDYCGECVVCIDLAGGNPPKGYRKTIDSLTTKQEIFYNHNICFVTMNKIKRDERFKEKIRVVKKY